jgi:hypothetical protein
LSTAGRVKEEPVSWPTEIRRALSCGAVSAVMWTCGTILDQPHRLWYAHVPVGLGLGLAMAIVDLVRRERSAQAADQAALRRLVRRGQVPLDQPSRLQLAAFISQEAATLQPRWVATTVCLALPAGAFAWASISGGGPAQFVAASVFALAELAVLVANETYRAGLERKRTLLANEILRLQPDPATTLT